MHNQIFYNTIITVSDGEVLHLYHIHHCILLSSPDPDDLAFFMNHLQPIAGHWRAFGLQLGLSSGELNTIANTPLLIPGGPVAYLQEVLTKWMNRAPPYPTLTKLCGALRSRAVDQSRIALELEQQYLTQRTGLSAIYAGSDNQSIGVA